MTPAPRLLPVLVGVAILAGALHSANLAWVASGHGCHFPSFVCPEGVAPFTGQDTSAYRAAAADIDERGLLGASWLKRIPGYPLMLLAAEHTSGTDTVALWWGPPLAALAAAAIAWLAWWLTGSVIAAAVAGGLFCLWPNAYQYSARLLTDGVHGYLVVGAVAATLCWRETRRPVAAGAAIFTWMLAQTLRPTFFALAALLPLLLFRREAFADPRRSILRWVPIVLVPAVLVTGNLVRHGVALPPMACYAAPRLEAALRVDRRPPAEQHPVVERTLFNHLRGLCMERYERNPRAQAARDRRYLRSHAGAAVANAAHEVVDQLLYPSRPYAKPGMERLYGGWSYPAAGDRSVLLGVYWALFVAGLGVVFRRDPRFALFVSLAAVLVMLPAANTHLVGARLRFPVDLLSIPVVVAFGVRVLPTLRTALRDATARARRAPPADAP